MREAAGSHQLRYLGKVTCTQHWTARSADRNGVERDVYKFRLALDAAPLPSTTATASTSRSTPMRTARPFDESRPPSARSSKPERHTTPEETAALQEKANQEHHGVLVALSDALRAAGWTNIEEIPSAIDLRATPPGQGARVIFEVKTLSGGNEASQCRAALSQLLEYRFFYGELTDCLCLVVNGAITDRRRAFLEEIGVAIVHITDDGLLVLVGSRGAEMLQTAQRRPAAIT